MKESLNIWLISVTLDTSQLFISPYFFTMSSFLDARLSMLKRLSQSVETVAVLDISQDYKPSRTMLYGEPYLLDYLENINNDMEKCFKHVFKYVIIPKHATLWIGRNDFRFVM